MCLHSHMKWRAFFCVLSIIQVLLIGHRQDLHRSVTYELSIRRACGSDYRKQTVAMDQLTCKCSSIRIVTLSFTVKFISIYSKFLKTDKMH